MSMWWLEGEITVEEEQLTGDSRSSQMLQGNLKTSKECDPCKKHPTVINDVFPSSIMCYLLPGNTDDIS